jgi:tetratricopeptide (TPR) repeat protein
MRTRWLSALLAVILLALPVCAAQNTGILRGQVLGFDGKPLAGATIILKHARGYEQQEVTGQSYGPRGASGRTFTLRTDADGKFTQIGLPTGVYSLDIRFRPEGEAAEPDLYSTEVFMQDNLETETTLDLSVLMAEEIREVRRSTEEAGRRARTASEYDAGVAALEAAQQLRARMRAARPAVRAELEEDFEEQIRTAIIRLGAALAQIKHPQDEAHHLILARLGEANHLAGRYAAAAHYYRRAIEARPARLPADQLSAYFNNFGNALARTGKLDEARTAYERSAEIYPAGALQALMNHAISLHNAGHSAGAEEVVRRALAVNPQHAEAWYLLGATLLAQAAQDNPGDPGQAAPPEAVEAYRKYVELEPNGRFAADARAMLEGLEATGAAKNQRTSKRTP